MKILRHHNNWGVEKRCHCCHSILLVERTDISLVKVWPTSGNDYQSSDMIFKCPVCDKIGYLSSDDVPKFIIDTLKPDHLDSVYG